MTRDRERYCVTGGAGFIGSNLADRLLADGHEVVARDLKQNTLATFNVLEAMRDDSNIEINVGWCEARCPGC